jgi:hypothetical protein
MATTGIDADVSAVSRIDSVPAILEVVCRTTGLGFAAIARVTEDRWVACAVHDRIGFGLQPGAELEPATTICNQIRKTGEPIVINHAAEDAVFCRHPAPAAYGFESYIAVPIVRSGGATFGALCALDRKPAKLDAPGMIGMLTLFAELIGLHLDLDERVASSEAAVSDARHSAELREQFIAVLGHDLRNPLAAIGAGARLLSKQPLDDRGADVLDVIQRSVHRMSGLIDNVLDFARGRLGGGLPVGRKTAEPLQPALEQVIAELRAAWPDRAIEARFALTRPVHCDGARIAQLLSNLLGNALMHGAPDSPIAVTAATRGGTFEMSVGNRGAPIPAAMIERMFQPFHRAEGQSKGLGLGLYIASEIARAHGGALEVRSTESETRFTFRMPG